VAVPDSHGEAERRRQRGVRDVDEQRTGLQPDGDAGRGGGGDPGTRDRDEARRVLGAGPTTMSTGAAVPPVDVPSKRMSPGMDPGVLGHEPRTITSVLPGRAWTSTDDNAIEHRVQGVGSR